EQHLNRAAAVKEGFMGEPGVLHVARLARVPLSGRRIFITGGAGFIGTALARRLVEQNELVILDNLHRDSLTGSVLADHPNLTFVQGDVLDAPLVRKLAEGANAIVHMAA